MSTRAVIISRDKQNMCCYFEQWKFCFKMTTRKKRHSALLILPLPVLICDLEQSAGLFHYRGLLTFWYLSTFKGFFLYYLYSLFSLHLSRESRILLESPQQSTVWPETELVVPSLTLRTWLFSLLQGLWPIDIYLCPFLSSQSVNPAFFTKI